MGKNETKKITTFSDLKKYADGVVLEFSPFSESQPFIAKVKRPPLIDILSTGKVPNELLPVALRLFEGEDKTKKEKTQMEVFEESEEVHEVFRIIARVCLVSPTYEEIEQAGMRLTSAQLVELYQYVNTGIEQLKFFRSDQED